MATFKTMKFILLLAIISLSLTNPLINFKKNKITPFILGGHDAQDQQFPYTVSLQYTYFYSQHICGAVIITKTWLITAGQCILGMPSSGNYSIIAGTLDKHYHLEGRQDVNIIERIYHPNLNSPYDPSDNDIGLLHLEKQLEWTDYVKPAKLPTEDIEFSGAAVLSGFTAMNNDRRDDILQALDVELIPESDCWDLLQAFAEPGTDTVYSERENLCSGPLTPGVGACYEYGDPGNPLVQEDTVIGVVSWGITPCGAQAAPLVYTKVGYYLDFILRHVDDLE